MDEIKIMPTKEERSNFKMVPFLLAITVMVFAYEFGIYTSIFMIPFVIVSYEFLRFNEYVMIFDKQKVIFYTKKNKKKEYLWSELKTIRYERYRTMKRVIECVYFDPEVSKKPSWINPNYISTFNRNIFFVYLFTTTSSYTTCHYSKYEFLDKLKEWGVTVEIDEKYIKKDSKLRKYVSCDNSYIETSDTEETNKNEWVIGNHTIQCNEYNNNYYIVVDYRTIKMINKTKVKRWGLEVPITLDNVKYLLVHEQDKFCIVKNKKYLDTNKRYYSRLTDWVVVGIGALLILACVVIRKLNLFPNCIDTVILALCLTSTLIVGIYRYIRWKK